MATLFVPLHGVNKILFVPLRLASGRYEFNARGRGDELKVPWK